MLSDWEPKKAALQDLQRLIDLLGPHEELTVATFCQRAERGFGGDDVSTPRRSKPSGQADERTVNLYLEKFETARTNRAAFMASVSELKADKSLKLRDLQAIAHRLTGADENYRTKNNVFDAITAWADRRFEAERRLQETSGIF
jgi:hypothetical protein